MASDESVAMKDLFRPGTAGAEILEQAAAITAGYGQRELSVNALALAALERPEVREMLLSISKDVDAAITELTTLLDREAPLESRRERLWIEQILAQARTYSQEYGEGPEVVFLGFFPPPRGGTPTHEILDQFAITGSPISESLQRRQRERALAQLLSAAQMGAPEFVVENERLHYSEAPATRPIGERRAAASEALAELQEVCARQGNMHPLLARAIGKYAAALGALTEQAGAFRLLTSGLELGRVARAEQSLPSDAEINPPLDAEIRLALDALIVTNAALVGSFPDTAATLSEIDSYLHADRKISELTANALVSPIQQLTKHNVLFDQKTQDLNNEIIALDPETLSGIAVRKVWLSGLISKMGELILGILKPIPSDIRGYLAGRTIEIALNNSGPLAANVMNYFADTKDLLVVLANEIPTTFAFIEPLLRLMHLLF